MNMGPLELVLVLAIIAVAFLIVRSARKTPDPSTTANVSVQVAEAQFPSRALPTFAGALQPIRIRASVTGRYGRISHQATFTMVFLVGLHLVFSVRPVAAACPADSDHRHHMDPRITIKHSGNGDWP